MSMAPADDGAAGADVDVKSADGISAVSGVFHPRALCESTRSVTIIRSDWYAHCSRSTVDFHGKCYAFSARDPNGTRIFSSLSDFVSLTN